MDLLNSRNQYLITKLYEKFGETMYNFQPASTFCFLEVLGKPPKDEWELKTFVTKGRNITDPLKSTLNSSKIVTDFIIPQEKCKICCNKLLLNGDCKIAIGYSEEGSNKVRRFTSRCKLCNLTDFGTFYSNAGKRILNPEFLKSRWLLSTEDTAVSIQMLQKYEWELVINHMSFRAKCEIFNTSMGYHLLPKEINTPKRKRYSFISAKSFKL